MNRIMWLDGANKLRVAKIYAFEREDPSSHGPVYFFVFDQKHFYWVKARRAIPFSFKNYIRERWGKNKWL